MKLWKVLARNSHIYNQNYSNTSEVTELQCRTPALSIDPSRLTSTLTSCAPPTVPPPAQRNDVAFVEVKKAKGETLGIVLAGPSDLGTCPTISSFRPGSVAQRCDQLAPGDRVRSVNGINTSRMRSEEVSTLLDNVLGESATLEVEYTLPDYSSQNSLCVTSKVTVVTLERVDGSLGITLRGGAHLSDPHQNKPLVVTHVRPYGPAHRSGRIKVGDRVLKVDNNNLSNKTLKEAQQLLKQHNENSSHSQLISTLTTLTIEYDVSIMDTVKYATGPVLVEIERHLSEELGLILSNCCECGVDEIISTGIFIESIIPASIADRCGALHVGDQILAVDDTYVESTSITSQEVTWLLQNFNSNQNCSRLQILPYYALANSTSSSNVSGGQCAWPERGLCPASSPSITGFSTINSRKSRLRARYGRNSVIPKCYDPENGNMLPSIGMAAMYQPRLGVCHVETLTVALHPDERCGYGLLVTTDGASEQQQANIIITHIAHDSPAFRCGCLQIGDRIISVNGQCSLTVQEICSILELGNTNNGGRLLLQTEFDVADAVVPTSGTFTVKLARTGPDLGITITASKNIPDDPFLIYEIRRGSAAYRTGTLHVGDHVLAIDHKQLDHISLETAFDMIQNAQAEIVTLRIEKGENIQKQIQEFEQPEEVVYTVELNRRRGPLGITVSGSEDRIEPIILSALTPGGLAEKTGALHIGDRILAINGEHLEQRPLSDAIRLLQTSGEKIQLKIARHLKSNIDIGSSPIFEDNRGDFSSPGLTSNDSAVESWDSSVIENINSEPQINKDTSDTKTVADSSLKQTDAIEDGASQYGFKKHDSQLLFYSDVEDSICPSPLPLPNYSFTNTLQSKYESSYFLCSKPSLSSRNDYRYRADLDTYSESTIDLDVHHVTLYKDSIYDDYGFSVSDGLYEKGVYINRVRRGGPAHLAGSLRPYDRILQVNDTKTKEFDCCLTVPLIASAGDKIDLIIARNPYIGCIEDKDTHVLSWSPQNEDHLRMSTKSFSSSQNTITKTL